MEEQTRLPIAEPKEKPKYGRKQQRLMDRINQQANEAFNSLAKKYSECFMENDPNGPEVAEKKKEFSAKWKMYCRSRGFVPESLTKFDDFADAMLEHFKKELGDA